MCTISLKTHYLSLDSILPPEPILTKWRTWINTALYYCEYLSKIYSVIHTFDNDDAASIKTTKNYLEK